MITASEARVHAIVCLNRHRSATGRLVQLPEGTASEWARKDLYSAGEIRAKHEKILEALSGIPTFELHYCDLNQAIHQLELLARGA
jgi:hypothetical protein